MAVTYQSGAIHVLFFNLFWWVSLLNACIILLKLPSICCYPFFVVVVFFYFVLFFPLLWNPYNWMAECSSITGVALPELFRERLIPPSTIMPFVYTSTSHSVCCHISNLCWLAGPCKIWAIFIALSFKLYAFKGPSIVLFLIVFHFPR